MSDQNHTDDASGAAQFFGFLIVAMALFFVIGDCSKFPRDSNPVRVTKPSTGKTPTTKKQ